MGDLHDRPSDLEDQVTQLDQTFVHAVRHSLPGRSDLVLVRLDIRPAGVGELKRPPSLALLGSNQALVLQLLKCRIDRPGARPPETVAPLGQLLHHLVSVERLLGQEAQNRGSNVAASHPRPTPAHGRAEPAKGKPSEPEPGAASESPRTGTSASATTHGHLPEAAPEPGISHRTCLRHLRNPPSRNY